MTLFAGGAASMPRHAVVGTRGGAAIRHVALLADAGEVACGAQVRAHDMAGAGGVRLPGDDVVADVGAWLDGEDALTASESDGIDLWLADVRTQVEAGALRNWMAYIVLPAVKRDEVSGRVVYKRFSCAGFVAEAYGEGAGVRLVDESDLPQAELPLIESVWGQFHPRQRAFAGLVGDGAWRILLPGYLLHAMRVRRARLPFRPALADADVGAVAAGPHGTASP
jgi:hypothetical protein